MALLLAFVAVPLIEIALFIQVGGIIGLWPTLAIVLFTAILGAFFVRQQGARAMGEVRSSFRNLNDPSEPLAHGAMILFSGALLLTPGFFTDTLGFLLLIPQFRRAAFRYLRTRINVQRFEMGGHPHQQQRPRADGVIDGDYEDITPPSDRPPGQSGWTKH